MALKVLFAAAECAPLVKAGGLADVIGSLPKALEKVGVKVAVALPGYKGIGRAKVIPNTDVPVFLVEHPDYFGASEKAYFDTPEDSNRFAYFSRQVVQGLKSWNFKPDVVHVHDWHAALVPAIMRRSEIPLATVLTIHNLAMQGIAASDVFFPAGLSEHDLKSLEWDFQDKNIDLLLQGIIHADVISTVSPTYAREILTPEFGEGLQDVLSAREGRLFGILNGLDYDVYDPAGDKGIYRSFDVSGREEGKAINKEALQKELGLNVDREVMLIGFVARLADQKGLSLIFEGFERMMKLPIQFVILGVGDHRYERQLRRVSQSHSDKFSAQIKFDSALARKIFAAADLFLVPSRFEPCGLTQMIAARYGALPLVRSTGGLSDSVVDERDGFAFEKYEVSQMLSTLRRALRVFKTSAWGQMVEEAMKKDFSWDRSAQKYVELYEKAVECAK